MANKQTPQALDVNATISKTEAFLKKNKKMIITAVVAVAVVAGGVFAFATWKSNRNEKGQEQLGKGVELYAQALQGDSTAMNKALMGDGDFKGFLKLSSEFSFTPVANLAHAYAGECYAMLGKYKEAIAQLEDFDPQSDAIASPSVVMCLASCYEYDKQLDKAVDTYKKAADLAKNNAVSPQCLRLAALILKGQNKQAEAKELFEKIKKEYPTSSMCMPQQSGPEQFNSPEIDGLIESVSK